MDVTTIPFNRLLGITKADEPGEALLQIRISDDLRNHLKTMHAGAMFALAEAASGECLLRRFKDLYETVTFVPVVREATVKYHKPGKDVLIAKAEIEPENATKAMEALTRRGRALIPVRVALYDEANVLTMTGTFEWFVLKGGANI